MTYKNIQDEVIALRFDTSYLAQVKNWINVSYAKIWNLADWSFAHVTGANLTVVGGNNAPTMPTDFGVAEGLYDNFGNRIAYLEPDQWRDIYQVPLVAITGPSSSYTVVNGQILLGPTPGGSATYTLSYQRRVTYLATGTTPTQGLMSGDTDAPIWPAEWHYLLVLDACIIGGDLTDDLGAPSIQAQRDEMLQAMKEDLVPEVDNVEVIGQWGGPSTMADPYYTRGGL